MKKKPGSRSDILQLLREHDCTVSDLADRLRLTPNAIRAQLEILETDGLVRKSGQRSGIRRPHVVYSLTERAAHSFPNAYGVLLAQLVDVLLRRSSPREAVACLREVGRELARDAAPQAAGKTAGERRRIALKVLAALGGEAVLNTSNGTESIEGRACPLAVITATHPEACQIAESLLAEIIGQPVRELCRRGARPRCRFQILAGG